MISAHNLPSDIVHEILVHMPDFTTLLGAIQSSKMFHNVFKEHPKSIVHAVLAGVVGPAAPQAARYALSKQQDRCSIDGLPSEARCRSLNWMPSKALEGIIKENHRYIQVLEDFYSQRYKDRTSSTNMLEPEESLRLQRGLYRFWLYIDMLDKARRESDDEDEDGEEDNSQTRRKRSLIEQLKTEIDRLSSEELLEILGVGNFCEETELWQTQSNVNTTYLGIDPGTLAKSFGDYHSVGSYNESLWHQTRSIIHNTLLSRGIKQDEMQQKMSQAILQTVSGADDTCGRCHEVGGVQLIGPANIWLLSGILATCHRLSLLPGLLSRNQDEVHQLCGFLASDSYNERKAFQKKLFDELVDIVPDADGDTNNDEEHQWSKDEWYCLECIEDLFKQRFLAWCRQTKQKNGAPVQDDCWYGYNCRTMTHRSTHALRLNHLCTPTRGDPPRHPQQPNNPS